MPQSDSANIALVQSSRWLRHPSPLEARRSWAGQPSPDWTLRALRQWRREPDQPELPLLASSRFLLLRHLPIIRLTANTPPPSQAVLVRQPLPHWWAAL